MNRQEIESRVKRVISEQLDTPVDQIQLESVITTDLCADSLSVVEMLMSLEEEFGIEVPDEESMNLKTVGDVVNYVEAHS